MGATKLLAPIIRVCLVGRWRRLLWRGREGVRSCSEGVKEFKANYWLLLIVMMGSCVCMYIYGLEAGWRCALLFCFLF